MNKGRAAGSIKRILATYSDVFEILRAYMTYYGGLLAIASSPYFHISLLILLVTAGIWSQPSWWDIPLSVLPNLIAFTLAGYALFVGFGDEKFRRLMGSGTDGRSPMLEIGAAFVHFILVQVIALILAILCKARPLTTMYGYLGSMGLHPPELQRARLILGEVMSATSFLTFIYSLMCVIATTLSVFRVTRWFNLHQGHRPPE